MTTRTLVHTLGVAALLAVLASPASATAVINIINMDGPGEGLNDPTPVAPVGGNPGTTIGQQRLLCLERAAAIWGAALTSAVPINVEAKFDPIVGCTATSPWPPCSGTNITPIANQPSLEFQGYWYPQALANRQAGVDLDPSTNDISVWFVSNNGQVDCIPQLVWYYGFDEHDGRSISGSPTQMALVTNALHQFAHGLGFKTMTNVLTGEYLGSPDNPLPSINDKFLFSEATGLHWDEMAPAERVASITNIPDNLTWDVPGRLNPDGSVHRGALNFMAPLRLWHAAEMLVPFGTGSLQGGHFERFGGRLTSAGVSGEAVMVVDDLAPTGDGCETLTNAAALAGKIAVVDGGLCQAGTKARKAQDAGAIGFILVRNSAGSSDATYVGGFEPTITIPGIFISQADGTTLKSAMAGGPTGVTLRVSPTAIPGVAPSGRMRMNWTNAPSSTTASHLQVWAVPSPLMEVGMPGAIFGSSSLDLTPYYLEDIGWFGSTGTRTTDVPRTGPASRVALASRPNPSRGSASVHFELSSDETLQLTLYDVSGRQVRVLANGAFAAGPHDVAWDGLDATGRRAAPGVYLARLKVTRTQATHHLVLVE